MLCDFLSYFCSSGILSSECKPFYSLLSWICAHGDLVQFVKRQLDRYITCNHNLKYAYMVYYSEAVCSA